IDVVAARDVALGAQRIQAEGRVVVELPVAVDGGAQIAVVAEPQRAVCKVAQLRPLADEVDAAASRSAAAKGGIRPSNDFHSFQVEDFACLAPRVAYAVNINVAARRTAPDERPVGQGLPALARAKSNAGGIAQHVFQ